MVKIFINKKEVEIESGITVLQACEQAGIEILKNKIFLAFQLI